MAKIALIGGTGLTSLSNLEYTRQETINTPYGEPSAPLCFGKIHNTEVVFLARHGSEHTVPPHKINYQANIWALHHIGVTDVIAVNAVGGISSKYKPTTISVPNQIIDYTYSRKNTFFEDDLNQVVHIDFTEPYCRSLCDLIINSAKQNNIDIIPSGTYAATQGPRLESIAEIRKLENDGCDIVGMTGMPEAALARELELCYASIAVVANYAAGKSESNITMDIIEQNLKTGIVEVKSLLEAVINNVSIVNNT